MTPFTRRIVLALLVVSLPSIAVLVALDLTSAAVPEALLDILLPVVVGLLAAGLTLWLTKRTDQKEKEYFDHLYAQHVQPAITTSVEEFVSPRIESLVEDLLGSLRDDNRTFLKEKLLREVVKFCSPHKIRQIKEDDTYVTSSALLEEFDPQEISIVMASREFQLTDELPAAWNKTLLEHVKLKRCSLRRVITVVPPNHGEIQEDMEWIRKLLELYKGATRCDMFCVIEPLNVSVGTFLNRETGRGNAALLFGFVANRRLHHAFCVTEQYGTNEFCTNINNWITERYSLHSPLYWVMRSGEIDEPRLEKLEKELYATTS